MEGTTGKKLTKSASGLRMVPTGENYASPFALEEPMWVPDKDVTKCTSCNQEFAFMNRRHHCRRCGKCFCGICCSNNIPLKRMYFIDPVRQCYECAVISKREQEFYEKSLKILMEGTVQTVTEGKTESGNINQLGTYMCRLTSDSRYIEFIDQKRSPDNVPPTNVLLTKVIGAQVLTEAQSPTGSPDRQVATGLAIKYRDEENSSVIYDITLNSLDQKASAPWLISAHKALKMMFESRKQSVQ